MTIEIRDASLEARIQKQLQAAGSSSVEEVLLCLLDTQEEQDRWMEVCAWRVAHPRFLTRVLVSKPEGAPP
jgi:hypothetical protein